MNDFSGTLEGIELGFGRKTGYGSDGPDDSFQRGGRVFKFKEVKDGTRVDILRETYIINEDGSKDRGELSWSSLGR